MEGASSLSLGWQIFAIVFVGALGAAIYLIAQETRSSRQRGFVLQQAEKALEDLGPPLKEIEEYEARRAELFSMLQQQGLVSAGEEDLDEGVLPSSSWQRRLLEPSDRKALKLLLLRRALANSKRWVQLSSQANAKYRLYRNGLLTETAWGAFQKIQEELNRELQYLKVEAECIEPDWGEKVLREGVLLHRLQMMQREKAQQQQEQQLQQQQQQQQQHKQQDDEQETKGEPRRRTAQQTS
ncbi:hypothetical protein Emag_007172 [Eimeria magna]